MKCSILILTAISLILFATSIEAYADDKLIVEYFYMKVDCPDCPPSPLYELVMEIKSEYEDEVDFIGWNAHSPAGMARLQEYNLTVAEWMVINYTYPIPAEGMTKEKLKEAIENYLAGNVTGDDACVDISVSEAKTMMDSDPLLLILDVRDQSEYDTGHIQHARLIPVSQLEARIGELDKNRDTLVYCRSGYRSRMACEILANYSFPRVYNMPGGILAWESAGYPIYVRYSSIQEAINISTDGDSVFVASGTYYGHVVVNKTVSLVGEDPETTFIDGNGMQIILEIISPDVNVTGFTIKDGSDGFHLTRDAYSCIIADCRIENNSRGIFVNSDDTLLTGNKIVNNNEKGIEIFAACGCNPVWRNVVTENLLFNNSYGIYLRNSGEGLVYHNSFLNNTQQVYRFNSHTNWDNGYPSGGNYWSDYAGVDEKSGPDQDQPGSDGIGDTPYVIEDVYYTTIQDQYPLMNPWTPPADTTPPVTTSSLSGAQGDNGWFTSDVTVTLSATDDTEVDRTEYSFDNATWITYTTPFTFNDEGHTKFYYRSTDKVGNMETIRTQTMKIDKTAPAGTITINKGDAYAASTLVTLTLTSTDMTSGVSHVRLSNDGVWDTQPWEEPAATKYWVLPSGDGTKTVYVQYVDNAGLVSQPYSNTITLDTAAPTIAITSPSPGQEIKSSTNTVTWTGSDDTSTISHYEIKLDDNSWINVGTNTTYTFTGLDDGSHTVEIKATDKAGLTSENSLVFIVNASPLLGPGYAEEGVLLATTIIAALGIAFYFFKIRRD